MKKKQTHKTAQIISFSFLKFLQIIHCDLQNDHLCYYVRYLGLFLGTYTIMLFRCLCYYVYQSSFSHNIRLPVLAYLTSAHYNNANAGSVN